MQRSSVLELFRFNDKLNSEFPDYFIANGRYNLFRCERVILQFNRCEGKVKM